MWNSYEPMPVMMLHYADQV